MRPGDKLVADPQSLQVVAASLRAQGRRIVFTNGCFDLLHRGHVEYLCEARAQGDALIVGLNSDSSVQALKGPSRPVVPESDRAVLLAALGCVDYVYIFSTPRCDGIIPSVCPDVYVKSKPYSVETLDPSERAALEACGSQIYFTEPVAGCSTTDLIAKIKALPEQ